MRDLQDIYDDYKKNGKRYRIESSPYNRTRRPSKRPTQPDDYQVKDKYAYWQLVKKVTFIKEIRQK